MSQPPKKTSGEHPAVKEMRAKFESMQEGTLVEVEELNARIAAGLARVKSHPPPATPLPELNTDIMSTVPESDVPTPTVKDPRREPNDNAAVPVDMVELEEPDPFPSLPPKPEKKA
jgi:hypothetical protein